MSKNIKAITQEEKEVIRYINLARLYPKKFASIELKKAIAEELEPELDDADLDVEEGAEPVRRRGRPRRA
jgi:hypothetical protein